MCRRSRAAPGTDGGSAQAEPVRRQHGLCPCGGCLSLERKARGVAGHMPHYIGAMADTSIHQRMNAGDWAILAALSVLWGCSFFFLAIGLRELPPFTLVLARVGFSAVLLLDSSESMKGEPLKFRISPELGY